MSVIIYVIKSYPLEVYSSVVCICMFKCVYGVDAGVCTHVCSYMWRPVICHSLGAIHLYLLWDIACHWPEAHWLIWQWAPCILLSFLPGAGITSMCLPPGFFRGFWKLNLGPLSPQPSNSVILNILTGLCNHPHCSCKLLSHFQMKSKLILIPVVSISYKWDMYLLCLISVFVTMVGSLFCMVIIGGLAALHSL